MYRSKILVFSLVVFLLISGCQDKEIKSETEKDLNTNNTLSKVELADGWQLLFDGKTTNGWHKFNGKGMTDGWTVENETFVALGKGGDIGGDIVSDNDFDNFDLKLEWKVSAGGNSGVFYHVVEGDQYKALYYTGPEYQLIDDIGFPSKLGEWQKTGANYDMHLADNNVKKLNKAGEWNSSRIVVKDSLVQHYLNGIMIVEFKQWTDEWKELKEKSKWNEHKDYARFKSGKIGLQDHGNKIWFRNIKIKKL